MELKKVALATILFLNTATYADCQQKVQPIKAGAVAACDGFLFSPDAEKEAEQYRDDADFYKNLSSKLQEKSDIEANQNQVLEKRLQLYITESSTLSDKVAQKNTTEGLYRFAYFALGVITTTLVVRNVHQ